MSSVGNDFQAAIAAINKQDLSGAERLLKKVLRQQPRNFEALNLVAIVAMMSERHAKAEPYLKAALDINAHNDATLSNYGFVLKTLNRPDEALRMFSQALAVNPANPVTWNNRGTANYDLKRYEDAIADFDRAIALDPRFADAFCSKGNSFGQLKRFDEAFAAYDTALSLNPGLAEAWHGRGTLFSERKRFDEAFQCYDKAFALNPDLTEVEGLRLHARMHLCDWGNFAGESRRLIEAVEHGKENAGPFAFVAIDSTASQQLTCARMWIAKKYPRAREPLWRGEIYRHEKIRIGYVSSDFYSHATAYLLAGLIECHDRSRFEVTGISIGPNDNSETRRRLEAAFDSFIEAGAMSDADVAAEIRKTEIDILIDLKGFTQDSRTEIFARRPAPVQVNYLGYPGTMGADYIDYIVGDTVVTPVSHRQHYSEKIVSLPHSYQPNDDKRKIADRVFTRAECGLPDGKFVFCCFNNAYKILPPTFDCWMRLLRQVEGSVLWLFETNATATVNLRKEAAARGIEAGRLVFAPPLPLSEHLARHRLADLFLDTLPYNAHTTASDALWAGLPVLTQIGQTFAGRVAASLLNAVGLPEMIAQTPVDYERIALDLALNPEKLAAIKAALAAKRLTAPLFDTPLYAQQIESAFAAMVERYRKGLPPDHIGVSA